MKELKLIQFQPLSSILRIYFIIFFLLYTCLTGFTVGSLNALQVVLNGVAYPSTAVLSRVPKSSRTGASTLSMIYINSIIESLPGNCLVQLFANDTKQIRRAFTVEDCFATHQDTNKFVNCKSFGGNFFAPEIQGQTLFKIAIFTGLLL